MFLRNGKIYHGRFAGFYVDFLRPHFWRAVDRALYFHLRPHLEDFRFGENLPTFMLCGNFVFCRRHVGQFELTMLVRYGVVRMLHQQVGIHPNVACIAF